MPAQRSPRLLGMTLMEILVVLSIIALVVGMSVPALTRFAGRARLNTVTRQTVGLLSLARSLSIGSPQGHTVTIDAEHGRLTVRDNASGELLEHVVRIPTGVEVNVEEGGQKSQATELVFQPNGALRGRTTALILKDGQKTCTITISSVTGSVTVN